MPDLDPRLMACAKRMFDYALSRGQFEVMARGGPLPEWETTPSVRRDELVRFSGVCIDEWLKQEASAGMITAAFVPGCLTAEAGDSATIATYTAMCQQARKEIGK